LRDKLSEESDGSRGSLLSRRVPYSAKVKIIELLLNYLQLLFRSFLCFGWSFRSSFSLDLLLLLLRNFLRFLFKLGLERLDLSRLL
jgi:hypothetical protein